METREPSNPQSGSKQASAHPSRRRARKAHQPALRKPSGEIVCLIPRRLLPGLAAPAKPAALSLAAKQSLERRRYFVRRIGELTRAGLTLHGACKKLGLSSTTGWRLWSLYVSKGDAGLVPRLNKCGRKPALRVSGAAARHLEKLILQAGSVSAGARRFAGMPACPPGFAAWVGSGKNVPAALGRALAFKTVAARVRIGREFAAVLFRLS